MRFSLESKVADIFAHYPQVEEIVKPYLEFFYKERLEDILFRRLSLQGVLKLVNISQEEREEVIHRINRILNKA